MCVAAACGALAKASSAHAQVTSTGVLDHALKQYRAAAETWQNASLSAATTLFWSLATISLVWTMGQLVLRRADVAEFFAELIRFLLFTGFWAWMLTNGSAHARLIIDSMNRLASSASGHSQMTSPSGIVDIGFHIVDRVLTQSTLLDPTKTIVGVVLALVILVVLALVAVNMLVTLVACWIVAYGGIVVLGFGGSRWTSDIAMNYYRMMLSLGLQVLAMVLVVGIGESFVHSYYDSLEQDISLHEQAVLLVVSVVLLVMVSRVPPLLGTLANGSLSPLSLNAGAAAGAALSTATAAGALATAATRPTIEGAGQLLRAAAGAAVSGGAGAAIASLLDGFKAGEREHAAADPTDTSSGGGGSVFAAPASVTSAPVGTFTAPSFAAAQQPVPPEEMLERPGEKPEAALRAATADDGQGPQPAPPPDEAELAARDAIDEPAKSAKSSTEHESRMAALEADRGSGGDLPADTTARDPNAGSGSTQSSARAPARNAGSARATAIGGEGDPRAADFDGKHTAVSIAPPAASGGASTAQSRASLAAGLASAMSSPAGAFTSPLPSTAAAPAGAAATASSAAATTAIPSQPIATPPHRGESRTPPTSVAAAISRAATPPQNAPFTMHTETDAQGTRKPARVNVQAEAPTQTELPTAYSTQTAAVDIEAEVAAFRDKES